MIQFGIIDSLPGRRMLSNESIDGKIIFLLLFLLIVILIAEAYIKYKIAVVMINTDRKKITIMEYFDGKRVDS